MGKQHISSGEIDTHTLRLIELKDINMKWDEDYLNQLIERSSGNWEGIDPDAWQRKIRGDYELQPSTGYQL